MSSSSYYLAFVFNFLNFLDCWLSSISLLPSSSSSYYVITLHLVNYATLFSFLSIFLTSFWLFLIFNYSVHIRNFIKLPLQINDLFFLSYFLPVFLLLSWLSSITLPSFFIFLLPCFSKLIICLPSFRFSFIFLTSISFVTHVQLLYLYPHLFY